MHRPPLEPGRQTPWSTRVPLDPLVASDNRLGRRGRRPRTRGSALPIAAVILALLTAAAAAPQFDGKLALQHTGKAVAFGPRPAGSAASAKLREYLHAQLKPLGARILTYSFDTPTPLGPKKMANVIALFPANKPNARAVAVSGHYDTKHFPSMRFVGANDAGSSTGFLLELARVVAKQPRAKDVYLVWFDGEEAFGEWTDQDSLYGSRHLADKWAKEGILARLDALINVDMIGDRELGILNEAGSSGSLRKLIWDSAASLGYRRYFLDQLATIGDDHMPFIRRGVNAADLIDFDYRPWHTADDTMDKLSADSFQVVGEVVVETLKRLGCW